ncbi:MAG: hypothetical protein MJ009_05475 [Paludibacteraceae bacterium]|nr:hypothetical protein [Paludibacteraceae bacterium]
MDKEITSAFMKLKTPDKFNNHDLSVKYITTTKAKGDDLEQMISSFLYVNQVPKRMISKWFNRDENGAFDIDLLKERGLYGTSWQDNQISKFTIRGKAELADAGEQLIGNTFLVVNNVRYIDKEKNAQIAKIILSAIASFIPGVGGAVGDLIKNVVDLASQIANLIAGFTVKITTYLYQIEWNDEVANTFYNQYYADKKHITPEMKATFESDTTLFRIKYIGRFTSTSSKTVARGIQEPSDVFRKVLARAIDRNIVDLQRKYDVFKVKVPVLAVKGDRLTAPIGMKEGITATSKYEVLERVLSKDGKTQYQQVGVVRPIKDLIWDNRYMSVEEEADGAELGYTTFEKVSETKEFYAGMLLREASFSGSVVDESEDD